MKKLSHTADAYVELSLVSEKHEGELNDKNGEIKNSEVLRTSIQVGQSKKKLDYEIWIEFLEYL